MSRCTDCDTVLTSFELTRQDLETGKYFDLCTPCFKSIAPYVKYQERWDLFDNSDHVKWDDTVNDNELLDENSQLDLLFHESNV